MLPSSVAGGSGGIIDATQTSTFVAQLNASAWIDAYQVIIRRNTALNEIVYNTGVQTLSERFYPTDATGNYVPFTITIPSSVAPLQYESVNIGDANKTVWVRFNMAIAQQSALIAGINLSTDDGTSWTGTASNAVSAAVIKDNELKITFTSALSGKENRVKIAAGTIKPLNGYFQSAAEDFITDKFSGFLEESLISLNPSTGTIAAGSSMTATVTGNKSTYEVSRNAIISIKASGSTDELASRTQADNKISYSILDRSVYFYVGNSIAAGSYIFSYTDNALSGSTKTVTATVNVIASTGITCTAYALDSSAAVVSLTMNKETANAKSSLTELASSIQLSTDGGATWNGTTSNPVVAVGFTNEAQTYTKAAVYNMRIEFTSPLAGSSNVIKIPAGSIKSGETQNTEIITAVIAVPETTSDSAGENASQDTSAPVNNQMVNGYANGYKWTLKIWNGYDAGDPESQAIESFESCFDCKDTPSVSISGPSVVTARSATWTGAYSHGQDVPLMWNRWQLLIAGEVVRDTGMQYSNSALSYSYDGLIAGTSYVLKLTCATQDGVEVSASHPFTVNYTTLDSNGIVKATAQRDGSVYIQCRNMKYITGQPSSDGYEYLPDTPVPGHNSVSTDDGASIDFVSTEDADMDFADGDVLMVRLHSRYDGILLSFVLDDGSLSFTLSHRGLMDGLLPNTDLYPSTDLYPDPTKFGEFVYVVNGKTIAVIPTPDYGYNWYTLYLTTTSITCISHKGGAT